MWVYLNGPTGSSHTAQADEIRCVIERDTDRVIRCYSAGMEGTYDESLRATFALCTL
jgi:hypothetical protein